MTVSAGELVRTREGAWNQLVLVYISKVSLAYSHELDDLKTVSSDIQRSPRAHTNGITVEAFDLSTIGDFLFFLGAVLSSMAEVVTVAAFRNTAVNGLTSIRETNKVLLGSGWPSILLLRTLVVRGQAPRDRKLLVQVTLEVHIGIGQGKLLLHSNEKHVNLLRAKSILQLGISGIGSDLEVLQGSFSNVIEVAVIGGSNQLVPSNLGRDICDVRTVDLARILALESKVAW